MNIKRKHITRLIIGLLLIVFCVPFSFGETLEPDTLKSDSTLVVAQDSLQTVIVPAPLPAPEVPGYLQKLASDPGWPFILIILFIFIIVHTVYRNLYNSVSKILHSGEELSPGRRHENEEIVAQSKATKGAIKYIGWMLLAGYLIYVGVRGTMMQGFVMEWLNLIVRWAHVVAGIMWIGASFYFIFLENNLNRTHDVREELAGNLWAIHGGGFYFLEKYKVAPKIIPRDLHWFKYEAYFTWLTGVGMLFIVYYMDAKSFLIDKSVADISVGTGIGIGIGTLVLGWILYDRMCKSWLITRPKLFAVVGLILLTCIAYFLAHVFNSRAAFIHIGALIGTIMVGNVFFVIIPSQKALVKAAVTGQPLDPTLGKKAGQRSLHNNYTTLPVIFIMISNHFPSTFGNKYSWIVLIVLTVASAGIKHYWNLVERGVVKTYILVVSVLMLVVLALVTSPAFEDAVDASTPVTFEEVNSIVQTRCVQCHSATPKDDQWTSAPNGVMYDTPAQIKSMVDKIMIRAVTTKTMPQGNKTNMTEEERLVLKRWITQGAPIPQ